MGVTHVFARQAIRSKLDEDGVAREPKVDRGVTGMLFCADRFCARCHWRRRVPGLVTGRGQGPRAPRLEQDVCVVETAQLVGRDGELGQLSDWLLEGAGSEVRGAVLVGGAGVGKTALARAIGRRASDYGRPVNWIQASWLAASTIPLGAFVPALGVFEGDISPANLLARAHAAFGTHGPERPLLIVDDAHLLDTHSAALVEQLVAGERSAAVLTVRHDATTAAITRLWSDEYLKRFDIPALSLDAVEVLLAAMLDGPVDNALTRAVARLSAGNLVILRELVGSALDRGAIAFEGAWRLVGELAASSRLTELVGDRLASLPEAHRRALDLLALAELLPLDLAIALVGHDVLADLEDARLVELMDEHGAHQVTVSHGTYAAVIRSAIGPIRARSLYEALADAAAGSSAAEADAHVALRATRWRLAAGQDPPADELLRAGKLARQAHDLDLAERCGRALLATGLGVDGGLLLADVLMTGGRAQDAEAILIAVEPDATTDEDIVAIAEARGRNLLHGLRDQRGRHQRDGGGACARGLQGSARSVAGSPRGIRLLRRGPARNARPRRTSS